MAGRKDARERTQDFKSGPACTCCLYNLRRAPGQGNLGSGLCWVERRITYLEGAGPAGIGPVGALGTVESPVFKLLIVVTQERGVDGPREQKFT